MADALYVSLTQLVETTLDNEDSSLNDHSSSFSLLVGRGPNQAYQANRAHPADDDSAVTVSLAEAYTRVSGISQRQKLD